MEPYDYIDWEMAARSRQLEYEWKLSIDKMQREFEYQNKRDMKNELDNISIGKLEYLPLTGPAAIKEKTDTRKTREEWLEAMQDNEVGKKIMNSNHVYSVQEMTLEQVKEKYGDMLEQSDESIHAEGDKKYKEWIEKAEELTGWIFKERDNIPVDFMTSEEKVQKIKYIVDQLSELPEEMAMEIMKQVAEKWAENQIKNTEMPSVEDQVRAMIDGSAAYHVRDNKVEYKGSVIEAMKPLQEHQNHMTFMEQIRGELIYVANLLQATDHPLTGNVQDITHRLQQYITEYGNQK